MCVCLCVQGVCLSMCVLRYDCAALQQGNPSCAEQKENVVLCEPVRAA